MDNIKENVVRIKKGYSPRDPSFVSRLFYVFWKTYVAMKLLASRIKRSLS